MSQPGPYFPFYAQDWLGDHKVRGLSPAARGTYIDLLALMWTSADGGLPAAPEKLARMVGQSPEEFIVSWGEIQDAADPILEKRGERVFSRRMLRERERYAEKREKAREAGRQGGEAKSRNYKGSLADAKADAVANALAKGYQSESSTSTESNSGTEPREGTASNSGPDPALRGAGPLPGEKTSGLYYNIKVNGSHEEYMERVKGVFHQLLEERGGTWAEAYPNYGGLRGVRAEMFRAYEWLEARPDKRKQRLLVFVSGWIGRNHDRVGVGSRDSPGRPLSKGERGVQNIAEWARQKVAEREVKEKENADDDG